VGKKLPARKRGMGCLLSPEGVASNRSRLPLRCPSVDRCADEGRHQGTQPSQPRSGPGDLGARVRGSAHRQYRCHAAAPARWRQNQRWAWSGSQVEGGVKPGPQTGPSWGTQCPAEDLRSEPPAPAKPVPLPRIYTSRGNSAKVCPRGAHPWQCKK
jgi:hypothetical protein